MDTILQKFKSKFIEEAQTLLNKYESDLLALEKNTEDSNLIESAFRSMHTLKGTSGMFGFKYISELTHKIESIFQAIRDREIVFDKELFEIAFSVVDHFRKLLLDEALSNEINNKEHLHLL